MKSCLSVTYVVREMLYDLMPMMKMKRRNDLWLLMLISYPWEWMMEISTLNSFLEKIAASRMLQGLTSCSRCLTENAHQGQLPNDLISVQAKRHLLLLSQYSLTLT